MSIYKFGITQSSRKADKTLNEMKNLEKNFKEGKLTDKEYDEYMDKLIKISNKGFEEY